MFFVVPGNSHALLKMPDTAALHLINVNNDSLQAEAAECKTNTDNVRESNITQEMHVVETDCANMDADSKTKHRINAQDNEDNVNKTSNYFFHHQI